MHDSHNAALFSLRYLKVVNFISIARRARFGAKVLPAQHSTV